ncbi:Gfo/Idh/MocA family oxidoreductase [Clostridia bacterium]|nr:Gfo/Idh/MocA family oxidoreductase [Clostridia bacterium]
MLKVGIVGCGGIAKQKHLPSLSKIKEVSLAAFCDIIPERAETNAKEYGIEGAKVYTDYKEMLAKEKPDVVHVLTPNKSHAEITVAALEAGAHVMCEKPMAKTYADAQAMLEAQKRTGKKLTIGYQNRFNPESQYIKSAVTRGDLGEVYFAKAHALRRRAVPTWGVFLDEEQQGGGPLIDIGTHALDLTLWCMDNYKVKSVKGSVFKKLGDQTETGNAWGDWDPKEYTVEDSAFGFITMESGATIFLEASWAINLADTYEAKCTLAGTKAGADMFGSGARINGVEFNRQYVKEPNLKAGGVAFYDGAASSAADQEARAWVDAILNDTQPYVLPEQAIVVTQILEAVYESARTGKTIEF